MKTGRRGWFARVGAMAVVALASPTAIVAPRTWKRVKAWGNNGLLTPAQADRFMEIVLDRSYLLSEAKVVRLDLGKTQLRKIRQKR